MNITTRRSHTADIRQSNLRLLPPVEHIHLIISGVMYWDWLITLDIEIDFMWRRARSASAYWFFAVRYAGLVGNIPVTVFTFYTIPAKAVLVGTQLIVSIILVRIHALYDRNLRLLLSVLGISLPLLAFIFWSFLGEGSKSDPVLGLPGCHTSLPKSASFRAFSALVSLYSTANEFLDLAAAWEALFLYDTMMFGLTVFKTYSTWRRTDSESNNIPIHRLILRDGALYFGAMALANLCNIITFYLAGPNLSGSLSTFASCMSVTLMARLMLNLYNTADAGSGELADLDLSLRSQVVFRRDAADLDVDSPLLETRADDPESGRPQWWEVHPEMQKSYVPP
ncbi:hypothetical protein DFH08DRAFT_954768 [Mycena albidolilacea]|uniref:DUF6533 domain-containing protein n=1 Tax=Mycena albidolilacea TaxID=1033008 RepID=A0AAD7ADL7_9AGAR|nr:hypothetical protein DFH08DRAFT_954768 [Mycena albidolilacea]